MYKSGDVIEDTGLAAAPIGASMRLARRSALGRRRAQHCLPRAPTALGPRSSCGRPPCLRALRRAGAAIAAARGRGTASFISTPTADHMDTCGRHGRSAGGYRARVHMRTAPHYRRRGSFICSGLASHNAHLSKYYGT